MEHTGCQEKVLADTAKTSIIKERNGKRERDRESIAYTEEQGSGDKTKSMHPRTVHVHSCAIFSAESSRKETGDGLSHTCVF